MSLFIWLEQDVWLPQYQQPSVFSILNKISKISRHLQLSLPPQYLLSFPPQIARLTAWWRCLCQRCDHCVDQEHNVQCETRDQRDQRARWDTRQTVTLYQTRTVKQECLSGANCWLTLRIMSRERLTAILQLPLEDQLWNWVHNILMIIYLYLWIIVTQPVL